MRYVTEFTAAKPDVAEAHFLMRLSVETDCADVHDSLAYIGDDFVLLHVVGREEDFARRHIPGAIHLPHKIDFEVHVDSYQIVDLPQHVWCIDIRCREEDAVGIPRNEIIHVDIAHAKSRHNLARMKTF